MLMRRHILVLLSFCTALFTIATNRSSADTSYNPLVIPSSAAVATLDLVVPTAKDDRNSPILVYLPASTSPAPVILFSHGLGGSRHGNVYLGHHWAARGYVVVFVQHPGSDDSVWKDLPKEKRVQALRDAADRESFRDRVADIPAVLDRLTLWQAEVGHSLHQRMDLKQIGMSGHSYGALTTQAMTGQSYPMVGQRFTDSRLRAALAMSPSPAKRGTPAEAFGKVSIPWMLMTGTLDGSPISDRTPEERQSVYPALPTGNAYQLVLDKAEHSAFNDRALPMDKTPRNPNHHRAILALSTAFWDAYLRSDPAARAWLTSPAVRTVLEPADIWLTK